MATRKSLKLLLDVEKRFNPDMLAIARDARGRTQAQVAKQAGITQALLSKIEHGLSEPSPEVASKISKALRYPAEFFYQKGSPQGLPPYHYRKRKKLPTGVLSAINAEIEIRRRHVGKLIRSRDIEPLKPIPQMDVDESGLSPTDIARTMREYWLMPRGPVRDLPRLIESSGAIIILCNFGVIGSFDGVSFRMERMPPLFFIEKHMSGDRFNFTLAHELAHQIMHTIPAKDETMEKEADEFASAFLMPEEDIRPYLINTSLSQLAKIKPYWKVSIASLIKRADDLGLISKYQSRGLWSDYSRSDYRRAEPVPLGRDEPRALDDLVAFHMGTLGYSCQEMSTLLLLEEDEFTSMYLKKPRLHVVP